MTDVQIISSNDELKMSSVGERTPALLHQMKAAPKALDDRPLPNLANHSCVSFTSG